MNSPDTPTDEAVEPTEGVAAEEQQPASAEPAPAQFENLQEDNGSTAATNAAQTPESEAHNDVNLDVILDVSVTLSMELGRARVPIRNLLQLNQGSVVELERAAGEPLDVYVNGTLIAHGEVVVVNERFGVRLTDVVSPAERIRNLK